MDDGCRHWKESGTEDADTSVDVRGCWEEIKTGLKAIIHLLAELWVMAWLLEGGRHGYYCAFCGGTVKMRGHFLVANNNQTS
jgi:hypothetical protein